MPVDVRIRKMNDDTHEKLKIMAIQKKTTLEKLLTEILEEAARNGNN